MLRDYYAEKDEAFIQGNKAAFLQGKMGLGESKHSKATGASTGIIGMLEVVESDFSKLLSEGNAAEAMAVEEYEKLTQDNEIATTEKETAVKYKTKDSKETEARLAGPFPGLRMRSKSTVIYIAASHLRCKPLEHASL